MCGNRLAGSSLFLAKHIADTLSCCWAFLHTDPLASIIRSCRGSLICVASRDPVAYPAYHHTFGDWVISTTTCFSLLWLTK